MRERTFDRTESNSPQVPGFGRSSWEGYKRLSHMAHGTSAPVKRCSTLQLFFFFSRLLSFCAVFCAWENFPTPQLQPSPQHIVTSSKASFRSKRLHSNTTHTTGVRGKLHHRLFVTLLVHLRQHASPLARAASLEPIGKIHRKVLVARLIVALVRHVLILPTSSFLFWKLS